MNIIESPLLTLLIGILTGIFTGVFVAEFYDSRKEKRDNNKILSALKSEMNHNLQLLDELVSELTIKGEHFREEMINDSKNNPITDEAIHENLNNEIASELLLIPWPNWKSYIWEGSTPIFTHVLDGNNVKEVFYFYDQLDILFNLRQRIEIEENIITTNWNTFSKSFKPNTNLSTYNGPSNKIYFQHKQELYTRFLYVAKEVLSKGNPLEKKDKI